MARRRAGKIRRFWPGTTLVVCSAWLAMLSQSCASPPAPRWSEDVCDLFAQRSGWSAAVFDAGRRWEIPPGTLLAVIHQESSFRAKARPPWWRLLGVPLAPASSAYGYGQATDATWRAYVRSAGRPGARRDDFGDAVDFVGWYADLIHRRTQVAKDDAYHLYLAYHEGPGGFARGSYEGKPWLQGVARRVAARAAAWDEDAALCALRTAGS